MPVSPLTLVIGHTVVCVPYVVRTTVAALAQLDPALLESSASLGASRLYTFRRVTLPLIRPGILAGAFIAFMSSFDNVPVSLFLRDARTDMLPIRMWQDLEGKLDVTIAAVSGVMIVDHAGDDDRDGARRRPVAPAALIAVGDPARAVSLWLAGVMALAVMCLQVVPVLAPEIAGAAGLASTFVGPFNAGVWAAALVGTMAAPLLLARFDAWTLLDRACCFVLPALALLRAVMSPAWPLAQC